MITKQLLEELQKLTGDEALGFCDPPSATWLYANRQYSDCLWYFWDKSIQGEDKHIAPPKNAIKAIVLKVSVKEGEYRNKPAHKLRVKVQADKLYVIECGLETMTAQTLIAGLFAVPDFNQRVTIVAEAGETEQVLFCRVFDHDGNYLRTETDENTDYSLLLQKIQNRLDCSTAPEHQPAPVPAQPKPIAPPPAPPIVEAEEETEIEYEFTIEDEQVELEPMKSVDELTSEIKGMTMNRSQFVLEEIDRNATHLGVNYGGVVARYNKHLAELNQLAEQALTVCKAVGMSAAEAKAKLGGKRDDCTLAKLKAFVASIELPPAEATDLSEIPF